VTASFRKRLWFVCLLALCAAGLSLLLSCEHARGGAFASKKMIILGVDGLDPDLLTKFMAEGKMPNFARLAEQGSFRH
jgi:predicted AlkP superfamily pyrophosphatase or phosphodiesterase